MPAVVVEQLHVRFGALSAVDNVSFSAREGQVTALLGPNGAGKTTTVETAEGFRRPASGTVRVLGLDPARDRRKLVPHMGVMLQEGGIYPSLSPAAALRLFAAYYDNPQPPDEVLDLIGLGSVSTTPNRRLSGGEQQRLSLGLAIVGRPRVAFLDEPTAGVDPQGRAVVRDIIGRLRDDGAAVVLTTHELAEAERVADHVVIIDHGRVVAAGSPQDLRSGVATASEGEVPVAGVVHFSAPPGLDTEALAATVQAPVLEEQGGRYVVEAAGTPAVLARLTAWLAEHEVAVTDLRAGAPTLEDVFLRLTGREEER